MMWRCSLLQDNKDTMRQISVVELRFNLMHYIDMHTWSLSECRRIIIVISLSIICVLMQSSLKLLYPKRSIPEMTQELLISDCYNYVLTVIQNHHCVYLVYY